MLNLSLTELTYILMLAKEKHFGRAAQKCFVSQPTLSIAIKKLEDNLGVTIFERSKSHLIITEIGQQILAKAKIILDNVYAIQDIAKFRNNPFSQPLRVGAIHTIGPYLFPTLMANLNSSPLNLLIEENFTKHLHAKLISGELDAAILAKPFNAPGIVTQSIYNEDLVVIIPAIHPWKSLKSINPAQLSEQTILLLDNGNCFRDQVLSICPLCVSDEMKITNTIITSSLETIIAMVANSMGISIVPQSALANRSNKLIISKPFSKAQPKREVILAWRNNFSRPAVINELINQIALISQFNSY